MRLSIFGQGSAASHKARICQVLQSIAEIFCHGVAVTTRRRSRSQSHAVQIENSGANERRVLFMSFERLQRLGNTKFQKIVNELMRG